MDFKTFKACATRLPENVSVLVIGDHGIGKSQAVYQLGGDFKLPVVERRLSQMSEGDMIGLPELKDGVTRFAPPDWYKTACDTPVILFLDELNRATDEIQQGAFQIVLGRELNGHKLHPETRVYVAVNHGAEYNVNDMDPALLDRFWTVELKPTVKDWLTWAEKNVHPYVSNFIKQNQRQLEHKGQTEPGKVYPSRRSWARLSDVLVNAKLIDEPENSLFYSLSLGLVGTEASIAWTDFVKNMDRQVSAEDVLDTWTTVKPRVIKLGNEKFNAIIEKLADHSSQNEWSVKQAKNATKFMSCLPAEMKIVLWSSISDHKKRSLKNLKLFHTYCKKQIIDSVQLQND